MKDYGPRICIICGKEFILRRSDQRTCGICGEPVGIHSGNCKHIADGWLYKRDCCKNGHAVDWAAYEKEGELNEQV